MGYFTSRCLIIPGESTAPSLLWSSRLTFVKDLVSGLDGVMFNDLMENIEWFFNLHDKNKDGFLSKDEVLTLSETFLASVEYHSL